MKSKESSSSIENKKYINDLSTENYIKELIHHKTNKESLMEMFLKNERAKHSMKKIIPNEKNITNNSINEEDEFFHKFSVPKKKEEKKIEEKVVSDLLHFLKSKPSEKELEELKKIYVKKDDSDSNRQHTRTAIKLRTIHNENSTESSTINKTENDSKENVKRKSIFHRTMLIKSSLKDFNSHRPSMKNIKRDVKLTINPMKSFTKMLHIENYFIIQN